MTNKINVEFDKNSLAVVINSLWKEPHSNLSVQPVFNALVSAYDTLDKAEKWQLDEQLQD